MILYDELVKASYTLTLDQQAHLFHLHHCVNVVRLSYGQDILITRGFSSPEDQIKIYQAKNQAREAQGLNALPIPMNSLHLFGAAADCFDPKGQLKDFILKNSALYERLGLYFESFEYTSNWVHMQTLPPKSGKRFFIPY